MNPAEYETIETTGEHFNVYEKIREAADAAMRSPGQRFQVESPDGGYDVVSDGARISYDGGRTY